MALSYYCTRNIASVAVAVAAATSSVMWMQLLLILLSAGGASGAAAHIDECPTGLVYPYWSLCWNPATYGEEYRLASAWRGLTSEGGLAPEWDEANSTYYVRLADVGAKYAFTYPTKEEPRPAVALSDDVIIYNVDTGRSLGWRQEGEDEWFLVEAEDEMEAARFQFSKAKIVPWFLPCPLILGARCEVYSILSFNTSLGLGPSREDGATYFKLSSGARRFPFLLRRSSSSSSTTSSSSGAVGRRIKMPTAA